jgi:hypothetical protein
VIGERNVKRNKGNRKKKERGVRSKDEKYYRSNTGLQNKTNQGRVFGCDSRQRQPTNLRLFNDSPQSLQEK